MGARGATPREATRRTGRQCLWLLVIGAVHAALLMAGEILGADGLLGLVLAGTLLQRSDRVLSVVACVLTVLLLAVLVTGGLLLGLAVAVWPVTAALALRLEDTGRPGPAGALLRRLVDGRGLRVRPRGAAS